MLIGHRYKKMGLLLPYLITKHLQEWFFIFVLKSLARTAQRYELARENHLETQNFSPSRRIIFGIPEKSRSQLSFTIIGSTK